MRRTLPPCPQRADAPSYRGTVIELPWPHWTGATVLLAIDWRGQITEEALCKSEEDCQIHTDRMTANLEKIRQIQEHPTHLTLMSDDASGPVASTPRAS